MIRMTPRQAGKVLLVLGIIMLVVVIATTIYYGSALNLTPKNAIFFYGIGVVPTAIGLLLLKFAKY